jgi:hypothetical protein
MPEYGLQLFQFQRRGYPEHSFAVEAAVRDENMAVGIESESITEGLDGDNCAGNGILFRNDILEENLQRFPGTAAQVMQKFSIIEKVPAQDLRDAEDEMPAGDPFQHICTEPFPEFRHPLLMEGGAKMTALAGEGKKILVVAVFTLHPGKTVVQVATIKITVNDLLEVGTEESVVPLKPFFVALDEGFQMILDTAVIIGSLWITGSIHGWGGQDSSPPRKQAIYNRTIVLICQGEYLRQFGNFGVSGTVYVIIAGITGADLPDRRCYQKRGRDGRRMTPGFSRRSRRS